MVEDEEVTYVERQVRCVEAARAVQLAKVVLGAKVVPDARDARARVRGLPFAERPARVVSAEALVAVKELLFRDNHK